MLDVIVAWGIGDEPVHSLGVVDVVEVTELGANPLLGEKFTENFFSARGNVGDGEVVAQQEIKINLVLPLGTATECVGLHGSKLEQ